MRTFSKLNLFSITLLTFNCSSSNEIIKEESLSSLVESIVDYNDFQDRFIEWNNLFLQKVDSYLVYIYLESCGHCNNIKEDVLCFAMEDNYPLFLIPFSKDIPLSNDVSSSIGSTKIDGVSILGTPTLLDIQNHILVDNISGEASILLMLDYYS